ncbi:hypothetical protein FJZ26_02395 [Candidatus Parvarchaeota archaeon]|nr:hypothetical protein [Candidatus Parvarchaeota archaeon]
MLLPKQEILVIQKGTLARLAKWFDKANAKALKQFPALAKQYCSQMPLERVIELAKLRYHSLGIPKAQLLKTLKSIYTLSHYDENPYQLHKDMASWKDITKLLYSHMQLAHLLQKEGYEF